MTCLGNHDFWWDGHDLNNTTRYYCSNWPYWMYTYSSGITLDQACNTDFDQTYDEDDAYYAFDYGIVHLISLSTYPTLGAPDQSASLNVGLPQYTWLENDLQQNTKPWTIVFCHIPFYDGGGAHNLPAIASCEPLFQEYGVDAVLQGHEHAYIRINVDKGTGNEIPYITLGCGGVEPETNAHNLADCYAEKLHFARFDVTNTDSLHVLVTEKHLNIPGNIDNFYIKNRPKKP